MTPVEIDIGRRDVRKRISRPRELVFEVQGVRWDDPAGAPWAVAWQESGAVPGFAPHLYRGVRDEGFVVGLS
ncbi:hypothetical protein AB0425_28385 [Actinosynnema sp. NPDC051121]|nr:hypothetical protein [Saccharothrix sp.]